MNTKKGTQTAGGKNQCNYCFWNIAGKCMAEKGTYCKILKDRF